MNINRHNYESYFLLYIDNELPVADRKAVDEFVQANPDLREELVMLQQSILQPGNIVFEEKDSLLQYESLDISIREKLLLLLDNELSSSEKIELDALIDTDKKIEREWNLLQLAKLSPDGEVVFEDKGSLYRREAGRVVAFPWRRLVAAAVFIGFGIWGGLVYLNNDTNGGENSITKSIPIKPNVGISKRVETQTTTASVSSPEKEKEVAVTRVIPKKAIKANNQQSPGKVSTAILANIDIPTIVEEVKTNNLPKPYFDNVNKIESNKAITAYVIPEKQGPGNNDVHSKTDKQDAANSYAAATAFADNKEENNNHILFMDEEKIKKSKVGGMFRKVKRVIERNTNIKTGGNTIKVANLEFAIQ